MGRLTDRVHGRTNLWATFVQVFLPNPSPVGWKIRDEEEGGLGWELWGLFFVFFCLCV